MKRTLIIIVGIVIIVVGVSIYLFRKDIIKNPVKGETDKMLKIKITINNQELNATLEDNETTREFIKELPLEITMNELNGNEKYYYMTTSLPENAKRVGKITSGDIMLYGSDCLVLFYESFETSYRYTRIGRVDDASLLKEIVGKESIEVSITQ